MQSVTRLLTPCVALACLLALPVNSYAWTNDDAPRTISTLGAHDGNLGFVTLVEGVSSNCMNGALYFDVSTALGRAMLATMLTARASSEKIRVAYDSPPAAGACTLKLVSFIAN